MINESEQRCCAEVNSRPRHFPVCGRRATLRSRRDHLGSVYDLYFCDEHRRHAEGRDQARLGTIRILEVRAIEQTNEAKP